MVTVLGGGAKSRLIKWAELRNFFFFFPIEFYRINNSVFTPPLELFFALLGDFKTDRNLAKTLIFRRKYHN
jgi:hypothetical protein